MDLLELDPLIPTTSTNYNCISLFCTNEYLQNTNSMAAEEYYLNKNKNNIFSYPHSKTDDIVHINGISVYKPNIVVVFHPNEEYFPNEMDPNTRDWVCDFAAKLFSYKSEHDPNDVEKQYIYLEYRFEYEANSAIGCGYCCFPQSEYLGYHKYDVQHVILLLDTETQDICHVFFKAHGLGQGTWLPWSLCEKTFDDLLIVHIARGSHAIYPHSGIYWRSMGFSNDLCSNVGRQVEIMANGEQYESEYIPQKTSITFCERFFLPCMGNRIQHK